MSTEWKQWVWDFPSQFSTEILDPTKKHDTHVSMSIYNKITTTCINESLVWLIRKHILQFFININQSIAWSHHMYM